MKVTAASLVLAALGSGVVEARPQASKEDFVIQASQFGPQQLRASSAPAAMSMATLRGIKTDYRQQQRDAGAFNRDKYERAGPIPCVDGKAGEYSCGRVDLMDFLRHQDTGSTALEGNDIWGWTASNGREFGAVGQVDGTSFVEVQKNGSLTYLGFLPTQTENSVWRDIKSIGNYIYIGAEAAGHGLQIFDMRKLLTVDPAQPVVFPLSALTAHFSGFGSSHNVVANEETQMIYVVGTETTLPCRGGLWMIDVSNPARPQDYGCVSSDGYVHDAQCVIYRGPHAAYRNQEICFNFNEDALTIVDVTRKTRPRQLSRTTYTGATYTHQGWLADAGMHYLLLDDEADETGRNGPAADGRTATYVVDISDLTWPVFTSVYKSPAKSIDHNQYVIDGVSYQSNYGSGLRVVDVRSVVATNGSSDGFMQAGFFDCRPEDDAVGGETTFDGAWSVYPYFKSGYILLNSIERGVFSLKYHG